MNEYKLTIHLHPSIKTNNQILTGKVQAEMQILDGIISVLKLDENIGHLLVANDDIKPGYLIVSNKRELKTTGIINESIKSDLDVRIIPISHGG